MKRHPSWEAWSEWVDGESTDAETMRRHLDRCAECAIQVKALEGLSCELGRLPALGVHPAFVTRVMARVKEAAPERRRLWWRRFAAPMAMAASVLILAGGAGLWRTMLLGVEAPAGGVSPMASHLAEAMMGYSEAASDSDVWELGMVDSATPDDLLADVAQTESFASLARAFDDEADLDSLVASLDEGEMTAFHGLVREYAWENETL